MSAREKIAYLRGLIDGQGETQNSEASKFNTALMDALGALAEEIEMREHAHNELREYVEMLEEDLIDLEECASCHCFDEDPDTDEDVEEEEYASVCCPNCEKDFYYEPAAYEEDEDLLCPMCGKVFKQEI